MLGQKTIRSPLSFENNRVQHPRPYSISNGAIFKLS
jgi:hypothetical protein